MHTATGLERQLPAVAGTVAAGATTRACRPQEEPAKVTAGAPASQRSMPAARHACEDVAAGTAADNNGSGNNVSLLCWDPAVLLVLHREHWMQPSPASASAARCAPHLCLTCWPAVDHVKACHLAWLIPNYYLQV